MSDEPDEQDPFAELGDGEEDPFAELGEFDDAAAEELFAEVDADADELTEADVDDLLAADDDEMSTVEVDETPDISTAGDGVVVPKSRYCERCEYFSDPPAVACSHEGTTIHELVDTDHLRVADCPVVAERGLVDSARGDR